MYAVYQDDAPFYFEVKCSIKLLQCDRESVLKVQTIIEDRMDDTVRKIENLMFASKYEFKISCR